MCHCVRVCVSVWKEDEGRRGGEGLFSRCIDLDDDDEETCETQQ